MRLATMIDIQCIYKSTIGTDEAKQECVSIRSRVEWEL